MFRFDPAPRPDAYLPELDGLRAFAALAVLFFHLGLLPVGWAGVWLFFVLSGFVITWMLLREQWRLSGESYMRFCRRRAGRIWPLYFLYAAIGLSVQAASGPRDLLTSFLTLVTFTYNFHAVHGADTDILHPLWTISVEQQFYLFYPLVFALACRFRTTLPVVAMIGLSILLRTAEFLWAGKALGANGAAFVYYWSMGQFDAFGVGALLAFHAGQLRNPKLWRTCFAAAVCTVAVIVAANVGIGTGEGRGRIYDLLRPFIYATKLPATLAMPVTTYAAVVAGAAMLVLLATGPKSLLRRVLAWPPLVQAGRISYGIYIWHMLVLTVLFGLFGTTVFDAGLKLRMTLALPGIGATIAVAYASYRWFESRFHRRVGPAGHTDDQTRMGATGRLDAPRPQDVLSADGTKPSWT